ncbi:MAG TPA: SRPBCC family protein [Planctomycetota bacterium]|nr:SRPBCC family protein [Planctomycetota bacterium]
MIEADGEIEIGRAPAQVFAWVTDPARAPEWLEGCTELALQPPGAWGAGAALRYAHRLGGHEGRMDGFVTTYEPPRALVMRFADAMFAVTVSLRLHPAGAGTRVEHAVAIEPKGFAGRLMTPLIRAGSSRQVLANLARLKRLLEAAG